MTSAPVSDGLHVFAGALHCGGRARRSRGSTPPERDSVGFPARGTLLYRIELPTVSRLYVSGTPSRAPPSGHGATGEGVAIGAAGDVDREALGSGPEAPIRRALSRPPTSRSVGKTTTPAARAGRSCCWPWRPPDRKLAHTAGSDPAGAQPGFPRARRSETIENGLRADVCPISERYRHLPLHGHRGLHSAAQGART
jgi:hypothetical protein